MSGWFILHRSLWDSPDFKPEPFTEREAFIWSLSQAAHSPHVQWFNGVPIEVGRGQFATSNRKLAAAFGWSEKRARSFMRRMEKRGNWTHQSPHGSPHFATILTVRNYERFQAPAKRTGAPKDAPEDAAGTHLGRTSDAQQKEGQSNAKEGEAKESAAPPSRAPGMPYADAIAAWAQAAAIKGWKPLNPDLTDKRRSGLGKILKTHGLDGFVAAIQRAMDSDLLGGPDPPAWFHFSFVCNPENFVKLKDGNYDRSFSAGDKPDPFLAARARLGSSGAHASSGHGVRA